MEILDLSNAEYSNRNGSYGGAAGDKDGIIINGEPWIAKYPNKIWRYIEKKKNGVDGEIGFPKVIDLSMSSSYSLCHFILKWHRDCFFWVENLTGGGDAQLCIERKRKKTGYSWNCQSSYVNLWG